MKVQNKTFIVTGAGGGIGGAIVAELVRHGAHVAALDLKQESLDILVNTLDVEDDVISTHAVDIRDRDAVERIAVDIKKAHGSIQGVVNCAGIIQPFVRINDLEYDVIDRVMQVNFYGTLYVTKTFLPDLLKQDEAHIVNVSSMGGFLPVPGQGIYGASKAAVKLMTEALYAELLDSPVRVTAVFPGATNTQITKNSDVKTPDMPEASQAGVAMLSPEEAAKQIVAGIERNKLYIYTGNDSKFMNRLYRAKPGFATRFIAKKMKSLLN
jgi:short-subunit dehydrogenase